MVEERDDVAVAIPVEMIQLIGHPGQLRRIARHVGIERDREQVAVADRVRRIPCEPPRRSLRGHQLRHRGQRIAQTRRPTGIADTSWLPAVRKNGMPARRESRSMIGEKLTFHITPLAPRRTASPVCSTKRAGYGVAASDSILASAKSISRVCSTWTTCPSPGTPGSLAPRESPQARNEKRVTPADAASDGNG